MRPRTLSLIWLALASTPIQLSASERSRPLGTEEEYLAKIPVVISATRLAQNISDTPASVTVIDRTMIEASGAVELVDLLRLVPGFQVGLTTGNLATVTTHGTGAPWFSRVKVLVDGHSGYHSGFSGLDWATLGVALADVERIEVVRGPNIATYGANAIQGTVNIVTYQPFQARGAFAQLTAGSRNRTDGTLRYGGRLGTMDYRLTLEHRENSGFRERNDSTRAKHLSFRGVMNPTPEDEIDVHAGFNRSDLGVQLHFPFDPVDRDVQANYQFLRWTRSLSRDESWYLQLSRDDYESNDPTREWVSRFWGVDPTWIPLLLEGRTDQTFAFGNFTADSRRHDLEFQHFVEPNDSLRLTWGFGYQRDELEHFLSGDTETKTADTGRGFGSVEWRPRADTVVNLNAMFEHSSLSGGIFSPRLGVNYRLGHGHTVRAAVSRAHKNPSLLEEHWKSLLRLDDGSPFHLYASSMGDLDPERRDVLELGYVGDWPEHGIQMDARVYHEEVTDAVIYALDGFQDGRGCADQPVLPSWCYRVGNFMSYDVDGLEMELAWQPTNRHLLRISYAYADVDGDLPYSLSVPISMSLDKTAPRHSGSILASYGLPDRWDASLALYVSDPVYWYADGRLVDRYRRVDLRLAKSVALDGADATLEFLVQNIGGNYEEFHTLNRFETRAFVRAGLQFR